MNRIKPNKQVDEVRQSPNYSEGRVADPNVIIVHHWGIDGQSHDGVVNYLCSPSNHGASAHYVVSDDRVTQLVSDNDRAWHAGVDGNPRGIGIECRPECTSTDVDTLTDLIAAIMEEWGELPVDGHKDYMETACPGRYYIKLSDIRSEAIRRKNGNIPQKNTVTHIVKTTKVLVDGIWGPATTREIQRLLGTPVDGEVSSQDNWARQFVPAAGAGWRFEQNAEGSLMISKLQERLGVTADGFVGPYTIKALQTKLGVTADGYFGPKSARVLQDNLNNGKIW